MTVINPKKLLNSKWTAVHPVNKEKHFIVTQLVESHRIDGLAEQVELEAVHSKRVRVIAWRDLLNTDNWLQGWK